MKNFSEEELELLKEVYRPDMGGIGTYCASFQRCMEILQDLNTAIENLYMIESHYFGPSQAWSMWFLVQGKLTIKDIAKAANVSRGTVDRALHGRDGDCGDKGDTGLLGARRQGRDPCLRDMEVRRCTR